MIVFGLLSVIFLPIGIDAEQFDFDGKGTVIIGGAQCQMIALDDGRFISLQDGALPNAPLEPLARVRVRAYRTTPGGCPHALPVRVEELEFLPTLH